MSATFILEVKADPSGLTVIAQEFQKLEATIAATAKSAQAAISGLGKGGSGGSSELTQMKAKLDELTAATKTLGAENERLTQKIEDLAKRGTRAVEQQADARVRAFETANSKLSKMQDAAYAEDRKRMAKKLADVEATASGQIDAESRVTQMILAAETRLRAEMHKLVQARIADNAKAAAAMVEAENSAVLKVVEQEIAGNARLSQERKKLEAEMNALRFARQRADASALEKEVAQEAAAVDRMIAQRRRQYATQQGETLTLLNNSIGGNVQSASRADAARKSQEMKAAMDAERESARNLHDAYRGLAGGLGQVWLSWGQLIPLLAGFAVSGTMAKMIKEGSDFGYQLAFVGAISGETGAKLAAAGDTFRKMATDSQFSATEVAKGARTLAQAGLSLTDTVAILPDLLKFSTLGEIDLAKGAEIAAGTMHAFGLSVQDIPHILDSTAKAAQISQTTIEEMGGALRQASTIGLQYNVSVDQMNALLAVLAQRNIRGTAAGTALRNMMQELDPATKKAQQAFKALGIQITDSSGNYKDIIGLLGEFSKKFNEFDQASQNRLARDYFNERGAKAFLNAIREANGELPAFLLQIEQSDGTLKRQAATIENTFAVQGKEAIHVFQNTLIEAFNKMEPELVQLVKGLKDLAGSDEFKAGIVGLASSFGLLIEALKFTVQLAREAKVALELLSGAKFDGVRDGLLGKGASNGSATTTSATGAAVSGAAHFGVMGGVTGAMTQIANGATDWARLQLSDLLSKLQAERDEWNKASIAAEAQRNVALWHNIPQSDQDRETRRFRENSLGRASAASSTQGTRKYNPVADKEAEDAAKLAIEKAKAAYRDEEELAKAHYAAQMTILRAYHSAKLISDDQFNAQEEALNKAAEVKQRADYDRMVAKLTAQMKTLQGLPSSAARSKQIAETSMAIEKAAADQMTLSLKRQAQAVADAAKEWDKFNTTSQSVIDAGQKGNQELRGEIDNLKNLNVQKKDELLVKIEGRLRTDEETLARLQNAAAMLEQTEILTAKQAADLQEIEVLKKHIEILKKEREERKNLIAEKKSLENDWLIGAKKGLQEYIDNAGSTAKAMESLFKKSFSAIEDALVSFVKTGKANVKDMLTSIGEDVLRMLIRINVTRPLAQSLQGWLGGLAGGGGGVVGGLAGMAGNPAYGGSGGGGGTSLIGTAVSGAGSYLGIGQAGGLLGTGLLDGSGFLGTGFGATLGADMSTLGIAADAGAAAVGGFSEVVAAAIPVIGWIIAIGAILYAIFGSSGGGPKVGGSVMEGFTGWGLSTGDVTVPGKDDGRFFTPNQGDRQLRPAVDAIGTSYYQTLSALGGKAPDSAAFGLAWDGDPNGSSGWRTSAGAMVNGQQVYSHRDVSVDDKEIQNALQLEAEREVVAALQASNLPGAVSKVLNSITDLANATKNELDAVLKKAQAMSNVITEHDTLQTEIETIKGGPLAVLKAQLNALDTSVTKAQEGLTAAIASKDPEKVLAAEQRLRAAVMNRYNSELQMVRQLDSAIRQSEASLHQFQMGIAQRMGSLGGVDNSDALSLGYATSLRNRVNGGESVDSTIQDVNGYVGAIDSWYNARKAAIEQDAQAQAAAAQAQAAAAQAAVQARLQVLNDELATAKQFQSVVDSTKKMLLDMQTSASNPASALARLDIQHRHVQDLEAQYDAATGNDKATAANSLVEALQQYRQMGQEAYQRPSPEWQSIYNEITAELSKVQGDAKTHADKSIELQQEILSTQKQTAASGAASASASAGSRSALEALNAEARGYYLWAQTTGTAAYQQQQAALHAQLDAITHGVNLQVWEAQNAQDTVDWLEKIHTQLHDFIITMGGSDLTGGGRTGGSDTLGSDNSSDVRHGGGNFVDGTSKRGAVYIQLPPGSTTSEIVRQVISHPSVRRRMSVS